MQHDAYASQSVAFLPSISDLVSHSVSYSHSVADAAVSLTPSLTIIETEPGPVTSRGYSHTHKASYNTVQVYPYTIFSTKISMLNK